MPRWLLLTVLGGLSSLSGCTIYNCSCSGSDPLGVCAPDQATALAIAGQFGTGCTCSQKIPVQNCSPGIIILGAADLQPSPEPLASR